MTKKVTILYKAHIVSNEKVTLSDFNLSDLTAFYTWIESRIYLVGHTEVVTNDYAIIQLLYHYCRKNKIQFEILNEDNGQKCEDFAFMNPNPTLEVYAKLYDFSITQALKGG